jgi:hypothetical protein
MGFDARRCRDVSMRAHARVLARLVVTPRANSTEAMLWFTALSFAPASSGAPIRWVAHPRQRTPGPRDDVVTDYDAIAHAYGATKGLPIKQYSEGFTLFQVLGSLRGLAVLDVACGDVGLSSDRREGDHSL